MLSRGVLIITKSCTAAINVKNLRHCGGLCSDLYFAGPNTRGGRRVDVPLSINVSSSSPKNTPRGSLGSFAVHSWYNYQFLEDPKKVTLQFWGILLNMLMFFFFHRNLLRSYSTSSPGHSRCINLKLPVHRMMQNALQESSSTDSRWKSEDLRSGFRVFHVSQNLLMFRWILGGIHVWEPLWF